MLPGLTDDIYQNVAETVNFVGRGESAQADSQGAVDKRFRYVAMQTLYDQQKFAPAVFLLLMAYVWLTFPFFGTFLGIRAFAASLG